MAGCIDALSLRLRFSGAVQRSIRFENQFHAALRDPPASGVSSPAQLQQVCGSSLDRRKCVGVALADHRPAPRASHAAIGLDLFAFCCRPFCDRIQSKLHEQLLDGLPDLTAEERWILFSAAKVVQDMYDAELIDLNTRMPMLTLAAAPYNESKDLVFEYLRRVCRVYLGGKASTWDRYARLWQAVNLEQSRIDAIEKQVGDILGDGLLAQRIRDTFDQMVRLWQTDWGFPQPESGSGDG